VVVLTIEVESVTSVAAVNAAIRERADEGTWSGSSYSSILDAGLTMVVDGTQITVVAWCDNE
jgi:glyceraldehyde-3-phosphate dehydrogenase/erythrose-4-phosphate dehydrogenase